MNARRLIPLAVLAVGLLAISLWLTGERRPEHRSELQTPLLPQLAARINQIERIRIVGAAETPVATLERGEGGWTLAERNGWPVDSGKLRTLLLGLAEARRIEAKTANPERHARLGVEDITQPEAAGLLVALEGGGEPLQVLIGDTTMSGGGSYARDPATPQSWLLDRAIRADRETTGWLRKELLDLPIDRIVRVEVRPESGPAIVIERGNDAGADFRLVGLASGREPSGAFIADATAGLLAGLTLDDVADPAAVTRPGAVRSSNFETRDGVRIAIDSWQDGEKTWAVLAAALDEPAAIAWIEATQAAERAEWEARDAEAAGTGDAAAASDTVEAVREATGDTTAAADEELAPAPPAAVSDPAADREQRLQALRDEVAGLNARFTDRVFLLPPFKATNLNRDLEAYLRPKG